jgi:hypothetical protein
MTSITATWSAAVVTSGSSTGTGSGLATVTVTVAGVQTARPAASTTTEPPQ